MDGTPVFRQHLSELVHVSVCLCWKIRRDSVDDSGISVLSICAHLSRKSLPSGISDAGRVSGLTHFAIVGVRGCVPASITSFVTSVDRRLWASVEGRRKQIQDDDRLRVKSSESSGTDCVILWWSTDEFFLFFLGLAALLGLFSVILLSSKPWRRLSTYPCARAADLGVPLLTVETHLDALADEQTRPHDDVEHGALALVVQSEVEHHWWWKKPRRNTQFISERPKLLLEAQMSTGFWC